ncbi:hypothetical protein [Deinococcus sonorensis]|uniref:CARDB domain-containing protein n=2 Tax=Deinococcus sonorensis TaxID=309891 RepID=A0AAU7U6D9_9DEIO
MHQMSIANLLSVTAALCLSVTAAAAAPEVTLTAPKTAWTLGTAQSAETTVRAAGLPASGPVRFALEGAGAGTGATKISAVFGGFKAGSSTLKLNVGAEVPVGTYPLVVRATSGSLTTTLALQVNVERWLLVDADRSENNAVVTAAHRPDPKAKESALDTLMKQTLAGRAFDIYAVKRGSMTSDLPTIGGPGIATLRKYSGVLWYTGNQDYQIPLEQDLINLRTFLDDDARKLILSAPALVVNMAGAANVFQTTEPDANDLPAQREQRAFLKAVFGAAGYHGAYARDAYQVTPVAGSPLGAFGSLDVSGGNSLRVGFYPLDEPSVQRLVTGPLLNQQNIKSVGAVALGRHGLGPSHTSSGVFLGISPDVIKSPRVRAILQALLAF